MRAILFKCTEELNEQGSRLKEKRHINQSIPEEA